MFVPGGEQRAEVGVGGDYDSVFGSVEDFIVRRGLHLVVPDMNRVVSGLSKPRRHQRRQGIVYEELQ